MRINTNKGSAIELTKRERDALTKAAEILDTIVRHGEGGLAEESDVAAMSIRHALAMIDKPQDAEPCPNK